MTGQAHDPTTETAAEAVEAMGGRVRVERGAGGGLAVVLRLCAERMPDA